MKPVALKFFLPLILAIFLFVYIKMYFDGSDAVVYGSRNPSVLLFFSLGNVFVPLVVALVVAGLVKLFRRASIFLNTWFPVFLIAVAVFSFSSVSETRYERAPALKTLSFELIKILKTNHADTCTVAIQSQSESQGLGMTEAEIETHCKCVGSAYFDAFTQADFDVLQETGQLPLHIMDLREDIQIECFVSSIAPRELHEIVVASDNEDLSAALASHDWTVGELSRALVAAAGVNNPEAATMLIRAGAPLEYEVLMRTPLIVAVSEGSYQVAQVLLDAGANPNHVSSYDWRPLHFAIMIDKHYDDLISLLIERGAEVNGQTNLQVTALHRAAGFCHGSTAMLLLEKGANPAIRDNMGRTAAERAIEASCPEVAALIPSR